MDTLITRFIQQVEDAMAIAENSTISNEKYIFSKVFITGMGGSGIAGKFTAEIMKSYGIVPVFTSNGYDIPNWIDKNTLSIVSSYSGNTEETVSSMRKMIQKGVKIVCITSGGKILQLAKENNLDIIELPGDWSAPRACFGYSFIAQLFVMLKMSLLKINLKDELNNVIELLQKETEFISIEAKEIALRLTDKLPVIYSDNIFEAVAIRFKQQLNENSKSLAYHGVFPEMNHNELVGWASKYRDLAVVILKSELYSKRIDARINLSKEIIINYVDTLIEIEAKGNSLLEQMFYFVHLTDWISWHIAQNKGIDAMEIGNIIHLKSQLSKL